MKLETILREGEVEVAVLRKNGHLGQADSVERLARAVKDAAADYLEWLPEGAAMLRSGRGLDFFKSRRPVWAEDGLAEQRGRTWWYRRVCVERRKSPSVTRAEARRSA